MDDFLYLSDVFLPKEKVSTISPLLIALLLEHSTEIKSGSISILALSCSCSEMMSVLWLCSPCPFYPWSISKFCIFFAGEIDAEVSTSMQVNIRCRKLFETKENTGERNVFLAMKTDQHDPKKCSLRKQKLQT